MPDALAIVEAMCDEFGLTIIPAHKYPVVGETRAIKTMIRILHKRGEDHLRWVLRTMGETANNKVLADETGLWAVSDLVLAYWEDIQADPEGWFTVWDQVPVGRRQWEIQQRLSGIVNQRAALAGAVNKHLYERFNRDHPDMLERAGL